MARGGINKALVASARQALLARGEHPSIDAVRIEMGNTGSKTTIHRYLKELENTETRQASGVGLSDELTALVSALSERLQGEAEQTVESMRSRFDEERADLLKEQERAQQQIGLLQAQLENQATQLQDEVEHHRQNKQQLEATRLELARQQQANLEQSARLEDREQQILSLEEKHKHAREALEHYRQASKEQREQDLRRHEGQVQQLQVELRQLQQTLIIKQDEITQLNRANERLSSEIGHMAKESGEHRDKLERQRGELATFRIQLSQAHTARDVLLERYSLMQHELVELKATLDKERQRANDLQLSLGAAQAELNLLHRSLHEEEESGAPPSESTP